ncbi:MAG: CapA family protein [Ilumatobacteraceae bacterium]
MKLALAGDTMLGRNVGRRLECASPTTLFADDVVSAIAEADLFVLNLECAISDRGAPWPDPFKQFWFRAPPVAVEVLAHLGVDCVTLANNHAVDYGTEGLLDTLHHLDKAGIAHVGAGADELSARAPRVLEHDGLRLGIVAVSDHPHDYAAGTARPGIAYANLRLGSPPWLLDTIARLDTDIVLVSPHWGPNMITEPLTHVNDAASAFRRAGATIVAGHSAHVFHGIGDRVLYDMGDFIDDYAVDPELRNDLGLLFIVTFAESRPVSVEAIPLAIDNCRTRLASPGEAAWIAHRLKRACAAMGTDVNERDGHLVVEWKAEPRGRS